MCSVKTPGVYIVEKEAFPNSIVEVATAIPAFIGYTEKAINGTKSLISVPWKIHSMNEFELYFGKAPLHQFELEPTPKNSKSFIEVDPKKTYEAVTQGSPLTNLTATVTAYSVAETALKKGTEEAKKKEALATHEKATATLIRIGTEYLGLVEHLLKALEMTQAEVATYKEITEAFDSFQKKIRSMQEKDSFVEAALLKKNADDLIRTIKAFSLPQGTLTKYYQLKRIDQFSFYQHMQFFYANGGGTCYIVSVGNYEAALNKEQMIRAVDTLLIEREPTMVIVPEAVNLQQQECYDLQNAVAAHCALMRNRVTIMDIYGGYKDRKDSSGDVIQTFREKINTPFLNYATAYYPWLHTSLVSDKDIHRPLIVERQIALLKAILKLSAHPSLHELIDKIGTVTEPAELESIHQLLCRDHLVYSMIVKEMLRQLNLMPVASAMAGIYSMLDHMRDVWYAPANIGITGITGPAVAISQKDQEDLNVPLDGKAVNAIRNLTGEGVRVWGARTLDGHSLDWKYIHVRRTMIMLEESIRTAMKPYIFEPNNAQTWLSVRTMISHFLEGIWKRGGLAGARAEDAFHVHVGLGTTMTPHDILDGMMRITVLVSVVRPAEFIEINFQQQMQKG